MSDQDTTIAALKDRLESFRAARGWTKAKPENLAMSITIEAAELLEHFQWGDDGHASRDEIAEEIVDVLNYTLYLANTLKIDITQAVERKLAKLDKKYPTDTFNPDQNPKEAYWNIKEKHRDK